MQKYLKYKYKNTMQGGDYYYDIIIKINELQETKEFKNDNEFKTGEPIESENCLEEIISNSVFTEFKTYIFQKCHLDLIVNHLILDEFRDNNYSYAIKIINYYYEIKIEIKNDSERRINIFTITMTRKNGRFMNFYLHKLCDKTKYDEKILFVVNNLEEKEADLLANLYFNIRGLTFKKSLYKYKIDGGNFYFTVKIKKEEGGIEILKKAFSKLQNINNKFKKTWEEMNDEYKKHYMKTKSYEEDIEGLDEESKKRFDDMIEIPIRDFARDLEENDNRFVLRTYIENSNYVFLVPNLIKKIQLIEEIEKYDHLYSHIRFANNYSTELQKINLDKINFDLQILRDTPEYYYKHIEDINELNQTIDDFINWINNINLNEIQQFIDFLNTERQNKETKIKKFCFDKLNDAAQQFKSLLQQEISQ